MIHLFDPDDIAQVYSADGATPHVPPLQETTKIYREKNGMSPGLGNWFVQMIQLLFFIFIINLI